MTDRILVGLDDSEPAAKALEFALSTFPAGEVIALHVIEPFRFRELGGGYEWLNSPEAFERARERAERLFRDARERTTHLGATFETAVATGRPHRAIVDYATDHDVDHVVVGSHGRTGASRVLLGSVAERVVRRSPAPVTVVR
ncbi:universal stress protein [Natronorarus salvus]|uniref:universal stress protein n=1 Tax=Natronorarus salvus TaxID=3117733 RepID=UPI002F263A67